ncbi:MAG TPA: oxidase [Rhodobacteraceae bacterium]|nr:oxidase [Paracoccaceae bacterium]
MSILKVNPNNDFYPIAKESPPMISRRTALTSLAAGGLVAAGGLALRPGGLLSASAQTFRNPLRIPPLLEGDMRDGEKAFDLRIQRGAMTFFPGFKTPTMGINGDYLGPTLRVKVGDRLRLKVSNAIGEPTTLHWHGLHLPAREDGGPHQVIAPGADWTARFPVRQLPATCWYHPHMLGRTGEQVWAGLAGLILIENEASAALAIPNDYGVDDIPLVIQDRAFNEDGSFAYATSMHDIMMGMRGDTILVNGTREPFFSATTSKVRFRILNGSNARFYNLGLDDGRAFHQIGTDGSFLEAPVPVSRVALGPGERADIVVDVSDGKPVRLANFPFAGSGGLLGTLRRGMGMMRNMMNRGAGDDNDSYAVLEIRPAKARKALAELPARLVTLPRLREEDATVTRRFTLEMGMGMGMMMGGGGGKPFTINGKAMDMARVDETIRLGTTEIWEISNSSPLPHPFHIHDIQFLILDRNGTPPAAHERGYKDTVTVDHNETVRVIARFDDYADPERPYMYHCHILEHEDAGMMGQFTVVA